MKLWQMASSSIGCKRKSDRGKWNVGDMEEAISKVKNEGMTFAEAAKQFNVPRQTLFRRVRDINKFAKGSKKHLGRYHKTFDDRFEEELVDYVKKDGGKVFRLNANGC